MPSIPDETYVSSASGKIRAFKVTVFDDTGTLQTVDQQVVAISDEAGNPVAFGEMAALLLDLSDKLDRLCRGLAETTGCLTFLGD